MDKKMADALKTLLEALPEEVVTEVTSNLNLNTQAEDISKQTTGKTRLLNFRLTEAFEDILEAEAIRTGQSKTTVLKAALAMYNSQDENIKNHWLLESAKRG
ncbi:CopG family transcriptional regulator [Salmonella enterica subsp. enterica serovar Rubislaw]|nr:CopG family transcriptional regulator [Salmonella enterica]EIE2769609.1 CopG family transcriptional regulator [Salmonella enterica subsp. enterica serovar Rubislaw]